MTEEQAKYQPEEKKTDAPILAQKTYEEGWTPDEKSSTPQIRSRDLNWEEAADQRSREWEQKHAQDKAKIREEYAKNGIDYPTYAPPGSSEAKLMETIGGINMLGRAAEQGQKAQDVIENTNVPKYKGITFKDLMNDPAFEGKRDALLSNAIASAGANALLGFSKKDSQYDSRLGQYNDAMIQNYANMQAEKDQRALGANLDALEAANAQKIAMEASLADTMANTYIERYKSAQDAETKKQVLNKMLEDADEIFSSLGEGEEADKKLLNLATLMGLYSGDFSLSARLIQKYAPQLIHTFEELVAQLTGKPFGGAGGDTPPSEKPAWLNGYNVDASGNIVTYKGNIVDPNDLKDGIDNGKYMSFNAGGGKNVVIKKGEVAFSLKEQDALLDMLADSPNLSDEDIYNLYKFAIDVPITVEDTSKAKAKIAEKKRERAAREKEKEDYEKYVADQYTALQKLRDDANIKSEDLLKKLEKLGTEDDMVDPMAKSLYHNQMIRAKGGIAENDINVIEKNTSWSSGQKADKYERIKNTQGQYLSEQQMKRLDNLIADAIHRRDVLDPIEKKTNETLWKDTGYKDVGGSTGWEILPNGNFSYIWNKGGPAPFKTPLYPASMDMSNSQFHKLFNSIVYQTTPEEIVRNTPGATLDEKLDNFKSSALFKSMQGFARNGTLEKAANAKTWNKKDYANRELYNNYETLMKNYNAILNGTFFNQQR